jgi:putative acetyltransferase
VSELDIHIRALEPDDEPVVNAIFNQRGVVEDTLQLPYTSLTERRERFTFDPTVRALVAEVEGQVVGMAALHLYDRRRAHVGSLGMSVDERYQGQGVGTALMRALLDLADNWFNLRRVELTVYCDNAPGVRLYEKFGFVVEGRHRAYAFRNGAYADAYAMARLQAEPPLVFDQPE